MRPFHPFYMIEVLPKILVCLPVTFAVTLGTVFFGSVLGFFLAAAKVRRGFTKVAADCYIYVVRCVPSIILLFLIYYGLPILLKPWGVDLEDASKGFFVVTTFSILFAANIAEVFRTAYESVNRGQREAAVSIGLSEWQAFRRIVLPQCVVVALPNFANAMLHLMKEGALAYTIGLIDMMGKGQLLIGNNQGSYALEIYLTLAFLYYVLTLAAEKLFEHMEAHFSKGRRRAAKQG